MRRNANHKVIMKITFLGQAGLLFETNDKTIVIDPYLSNSVEKINFKNRRRQAIDERFLKIRPDVLIFTHDHPDHYDEETVKHYFRENSKILVLSPFSVWKEVKKFGGDNNYVMFNAGTQWSEGGVVFRAIDAEHSDDYAIGVLLEAEEKKYYITGDTLYNEKIFHIVPEGIYAIFLPINGAGNNMNVADAKQFAERIRAEKVVPLHFGLFDSMTGEELHLNNKVVPMIYKEIEL